LILITGSTLTYYNFDTILQNAKSKEIKTSENVLQHFSTIGALQNEASNQERINRWASAIYMFQEKPILGFGPGTYQFKYGPYQSLKYKTRISTSHGNKGTAHSEYFTALSETGIFGLLIFLVILFYSLNLGIKIYYKVKGNSKYKIAIYGAMCGLITFYVHGLFNNFLDTEKMSILFYGSLAILVAIDFKITEEIKSNSPTT
jgi:O-antigen ligase